MEQWWSDTDRGRPNLKTKINPNYVQSSSSYRTVNTLPLYCKETATQYCVAATNKMGHARLIRLFYLCNTTRHLISETRNKNTDSPWFATIHSTYGCDHGSPPPSPQKTIKTLQTCATVKTGCDVKKRHCQSEMRAIPIYSQSQREIRLIKLL